MRVGNLTFNLSAYHGPKEPQPDFAGLEVSQMLEAAKKQAKKWQLQTAPQRALDSEKLARALVAAL